MGLPAEVFDEAPDLLVIKTDPHFGGVRREFITAMPIGPNKEGQTAIKTVVGQRHLSGNILERELKRSNHFILIKDGNHKNLVHNDNLACSGLAS